MTAIVVARLPPPMSKHHEEFGMLPRMGSIVYSLKDFSVPTSVLETNMLG